MVLAVEDVAQQQHGWRTSVEMIPEVYTDVIDRNTASPASTVNRPLS